MALYIYEEKVELNRADMIYQYVKYQWAWITLSHYANEFRDAIHGQIMAFDMKIN